MYRLARGRPKCCPIHFIVRSWIACLAGHKGATGRHGSQSYWKPFVPLLCVHNSVPIVSTAVFVLALLLCHFRLQIFVFCSHLRRSCIGGPGMLVLCWAVSLHIKLHLVWQLPCYLRVVTLRYCTVPAVIAPSFTTPPHTLGNSYSCVMIETSALVTFSYTFLFIVHLVKRLSSIHGYSTLRDSDDRPVLTFRLPS